MKTIITILLLVPLTLFSQTSGIAFFEGTWKQALKKAKKENKLLFVDCYADWCGPCKWMDKNVFPTEEAGAFYNKHFISYKLDMEKGEGPEIKKKYEVKSYPAYLYVDGEGKTLHRTGGRMNTEAFIAAGQTALDPQQRLDFFAKKYEAGDNSLDLIEKYAAMQTAAGKYDKAKEAVRRYLAQFDEKSMADEDKWELVKKYCAGFSDKEYQYVLENKQLFTDAQGEEAATYLYQGAYAELWKAGKNKDEAKFQTLLAVISGNVKQEYVEKSVLNARLTYYENAGRWDEYATAAVQYIENGYYKLPAEASEEVKERLAADNMSYEDYIRKAESTRLNNHAWDFYEHIDQPDLLQKALGWVERSIELDENYYNLDTYAALLFKTGNTAKAAEIANKAIEAAKANGEDYSATEQLLKKYTGGN